MYSNPTTNPGLPNGAPNAPASNLHVILLVIFAVVLAFLVIQSRTYVADYNVASYVFASLAHGAVYVAAVILVLRTSNGPRLLLFILLVAIILRAIAISAPPGLTTDAYRYVWDGRLQLSGISPYLYVPADPILSEFRDKAIYPAINQKEVAHTIYPPMAQIIFMMGAAIQDGLTGQKVMMAFFEAVTVVALIGWLKAADLPPSRVIIYAWHPLPIWEFSSQAHIDSAATAFLALAIWAAVVRRQGLTGFLIGLGFLVKYFPVVLVPALWRRWDWRLPVAFVATCAALYLPYVSEAGTKVIGFLGKHLDNEGYGGGWGFHPVWLLRDFDIASPSATAYLAVALAILFTLAALALFVRDRDEIKPEMLALLAAAFVFFTSPHYPWYFGFIIITMVRTPHPALFAMTILSVVLYVPRSRDAITWTELYLLTYWLPLLIWIAILAFDRLRARYSSTQRS